MKQKAAAIALVVWGLVALIVHLLGVSSPLLLYVLSINVTAAGFVLWDKWMAMLEAWRIPEVVLLGLAFLGGSPGAWAAMQLARHKTVKVSFRFKFLAITAVQGLLIAWILWLHWT